MPPVIKTPLLFYCRGCMNLPLNPFLFTVSNAICSTCWKISFGSRRQFLSPSVVLFGFIRDN
eukprot:jgi/Psemu1/304656/fgenesh1_kg.165_\